MSWFIGLHSHCLVFIEISDFAKHVPSPSHPLIEVGPLPWLTCFRTLPIVVLRGSGWGDDHSLLFLPTLLRRAPFSSSWLLFRPNMWPPDHWPCNELVAQLDYVCFCFVRIYIVQLCALETTALVSRVSNFFLRHTRLEFILASPDLPWLYHLHTVHCWKLNSGNFLIVQCSSTLSKRLNAKACNIRHDPFALPAV